MRNTFSADFVRIIKKPSFNVLNIINIILLFIIALVVKSVFKSASSMLTFSDFLSTIAGGIFSLTLGIPIFLAVFGDDFKSKAMQTSIGFGLSRRKLILCRFLEVITLVLICYFVYFIAATVLGAIFGFKGSISVLTKALSKDYGLKALKIIVYCSLAMIIVYALQNATFGLVMFIIFSSNVVATIINGLSFIPFFSKHHIDPGVVTVSYFTSKISSGKFGFLILLLLIYVCIPFIVTTLAFEKKELEF